MLFDKAEPVYLVTHGRTSPPFNLAAEEYFLRGRHENFILLWRNAPAIIIGRNQNAYAELDVDYVRENGIAVIRRLTGGGAVFHDLGNLNFTFIKNGRDGMADFREYLEPVTGYLRSLGLDAAFSGRNDLLLDGMKISGSAQTNFKGRVMLHGTLLFDVSLDTLSRALKPNPLKLSAKGIKSVRSRVTNIRAHLKNDCLKEDCPQESRPKGDMTVADFADGLASYLTEREGCLRYDFSADDEAAVNRLVGERYGTFLWNFGSAPPCSIEKSARLPGGLVTAGFDVKDGKIAELRITGDFFGSLELSGLENRLKKIPYEPSAVAEALSGMDINGYIAGAEAADLVRLLFL